MMHGRSYPVAATVALCLGMAVTGCTSPPTAETGGTGTGSASASTRGDSGPASPSGTTSRSSAAPSPTDVQSSSVSDQASPTNVQPSTAAPLTMYYIARDDDGQTGRKIGCGDSLVATYTGPQTFSSQLEASMEWLLSHRDRELGGSGLYNALHQSELQFQSGHVDGDTVTVALTGTLAQGGSCDAPRIKAQLRQTAMTSVGAGNARITVNGTPLSQLLGGKG